MLLFGWKPHMTWPKKLISLYFWCVIHIYHVCNVLERCTTTNYAADDPDIKGKASNHRCHIYARLVVCCLLCRCFSAALKPTLNKWCTAGFSKRAPEMEWKVIQRKLRRSSGFAQQYLFAVERRTLSASDSRTVATDGKLMFDGSWET